MSKFKAMQLPFLEGHMGLHHLRLASGSIAVVFLWWSVLASRVCTAADQSGTGLSTEEKRIIMGAQKLKKAKAEKNRLQ